MAKAGLQKDLDKIGFYLVGYGCTTCIGNSGPLDPAISKAINDNGIVASAVISGNRNFEGRVSPDVQAAYLASPPLVVAYALAGSTQIDLTTEPLGTRQEGQARLPQGHLALQQGNRDLHPQEHHRQDVQDPLCRRLQGRQVLARREVRRRAKPMPGTRHSTYVQNPPYFQGMTMKPKPVTDIKDARILGLFGDKITTDHISPAGSIKAASPAGRYLTQQWREAPGLQPVRHAAWQP